jgi:hypothetical protein
VANKDDEHPEFEDLNLSDDDLEEGGSDVLDFSETDDENASNLFEFSGTGSAMGSSLDLSDFEEEEPATAEPLDLDDSAMVEVTEVNDSGLGESLMSDGLDDPDVEAGLGESLMDADMVAEAEVPVETGKKAKGKKEKTPKAKKEKKPREKKVREKKVREKKVKDPSERSASLTQASPYTVMLVLSLIALGFGLLLMLATLLNYGLEFSGETSHRSTMDPPVVQQTFDRDLA